MDAAAQAPDAPPPDDRLSVGEIDLAFCHPALRDEVWRHRGGRLVIGRAMVPPDAQDAWRAAAASPRPVDPESLDWRIDAAGHTTRTLDAAAARLREIAAAMGILAPPDEGVGPAGLEILVPAPDGGAATAWIGPVRAHSAVDLVASARTDRPALASMMAALAGGMAPADALAYERRAFVATHAADAARIVDGEPGGWQARFLAREIRMGDDGDRVVVLTGLQNRRPSAVYDGPSRALAAAALRAEVEAAEAALAAAEREATATGLADPSAIAAAGTGDGYLQLAERATAIALAAAADIARNEDRIAAGPVRPPARRRGPAAGL